MALAAGAGRSRCDQMLLYATGYEPMPTLSATVGSLGSILPRLWRRGGPGFLRRTIPASGAFARAGGELLAGLFSPVFHHSGGSFRHVLSRVSVPGRDLVFHVSPVAVAQ